MSSFNLDEILFSGAALPPVSPDKQRSQQEPEISSMDKEIVMRSFVIALFIVTFLFCLCSVTAAQTPSSAINLYNHGNSKLNKNDLDGAIDDFTRAIELSSRLGPTKARNGSNLRNDFSSSTDADDIRVIDPFTANAYANRGVARMRKGDYETAIQDFTRALRIRPNMAQAYLNRGAAKRAVGDPQGALADTEKAISLQAELHQAYNNRASIRYDLGDYDGAFADLNRAIELNSKIAEHFYNRGYVHIARGDYDKALDDFNQAIKVSPEIPQPYQGRGAAWMKKGKYDEAITDFTKAIELNPAAWISYMNRGLSLTVRGRDAEAKKDLDKCLELEPGMKAELEQRIAIAKNIRYALINE